MNYTISLKTNNAFDYGTTVNLYTIRNCSYTINDNGFITFTSQDTNSIGKIIASFNKEHVISIVLDEDNEEAL